MELLLAIVGAIASAAFAITVVYLILLTFAVINDWFQGKQSLLQANRDKIAFTIKENLKAGRFKIVQGVFNKATETIDDARVLEADKLDDRLASIHDAEELVIYQ